MAPTGAGASRATSVSLDRVISTVDPDARHAHKSRQQRQDGFKAHLAINPDTVIITDCALTKASGRAADGQPVSEARTGLLAARDPRSHRCGYWPILLTAQGNSVPNWPSAAMSIWSNPHRLVRPCPTGLVSMISVSTRSTRTRPARLGSPAADSAAPERGDVRAACRGCPLYALAAPPAAAGRRPSGSEPHDALQRTARRNARNPEWQNEYRQYRPMVERTISWLVRGNRKLRYRSVATNDHWLHAPRRSAQPAQTDQPRSDLQRDKPGRRPKTPTSDMAAYTIGTHAAPPSRRFACPTPITPATTFRNATQTTSPNTIFLGHS